tara:strand:- start:17288 stop:18109 length:822 start_codon:yes stop_codon:yes gene_type:complete
MPRARNIKPAFFKNESLADVDIPARLLFVGLWTLSDFRGNLEYRPRRIKAEIYPYDEIDIISHLLDLEKSGLIRIYSVLGQEYINIPNFAKHQRPHINEQRSGSEIPEHTEKDAQAIDSKELAINSELERNQSGLVALNPESCFLNPDTLNAECGKPEPKPKNNGRMARPTIQELITEFEGRVIDHEVQAASFLNHYESNGWKVGKNAMKSWKHAVTNWITRGKQNGQHQQAFGERGKTLSKSERRDEAARRYLEGNDDDGVARPSSHEVGSR